MKGFLGTPIEAPELWGLNSGTWTLGRGVYSLMTGVISRVSFSVERRIVIG